MNDLLDGWKEKLGQALRLVALITKAFSGTITIHVSQGAVCKVEKSETFTK